MSRFVLSAFADEIDQDLKVQMDTLEKNDIKHIEIRGVNGKGVVTYSLDEVREIKRELDKRGFKISAVGSPIGKIGIRDDFKPHLELFRHTLDIADILQTRYIRMFSFYIPKGQSPDNYRDEVMERWSEFVKAAKGRGIVLLHENEKNIYGDTPERCLDILKTMDCRFVKAVFDPANFIQCDVRTYPEAYQMLKGHVVYMHIKDALYSSKSVVPSGYGDGKLPEILADLYRSGFEGFLSLEPHLASFAGFKELEIDLDVEDMPDNGPEKFEVALKALRNILGNIREEG